MYDAARFTAEDRERFWAKVERGPGCWRWTACIRDRIGYGGFQHRGKLLAAHKVAFILSGGVLSAGQPDCCRPEHLLAGTQAQNMADMVARGRSLRGERHNQAKLTEEQVQAIREGHGPLREDALAYGVSRTTVSRIRRGKSWSHAL